MNKYILIVQDFDGQLYQDFINVIAQHSTTLSLTRTKSGADTELSEEKLYQALRPYLIKKDLDQTAWPGTEHGSLSDIYHYKVTRDSINILSSYTNSLFESFNGLAGYEDLAFYIDHKCWFYSTSHEEVCLIYPDNEEILREIKMIKFMSPYALIKEK